MRATMALVRNSLLRSRHLLAVILAVLAGVELMLILSANAGFESGSFRNMAAMVPSFVRQMFGDSLVVFLSYTGIVAFGYFHPMIMAALAAISISVATEPVADVESRFLDMVLARPIGRRTVMARSALLVLIVPAVAISLMVTSTLVGVRELAPPGAPVPSTMLIVSLAANLWAVMAAIGGATLAISATLRRRGTAAGIAGIALVALFMTDYVARLWKPATHVSWLSPFHYYDAMAMLLGGPLPARHIAVLLGAALCGMALAFWLFSRRDL